MIYKVYAIGEGDDEILLDSFGSIMHALAYMMEQTRIGKYRTLTLETSEHIEIIATQNAYLINYGPAYTFGDN